MKSLVADGARVLPFLQDVPGGGRRCVNVVLPFAEVGHVDDLNVLHVLATIDVQDHAADTARLLGHALDHVDVVEGRDGYLLRVRLQRPSLEIQVVRGQPVPTATNSSQRLALSHPERGEVGVSDNGLG